MAKVTNLLCGTNPTDGASFTLPSATVSPGQLLILTLAGHFLDGSAPPQLDVFGPNGPGALGAAVDGIGVAPDGWFIPDVTLPNCRPWGTIGAPAWGTTQYVARPKAPATGQIVVVAPESLSALFFCLDAIEGLPFGGKPFGNVRGEGGADGFGAIMQNLRQAADATTSDGGPGLFGIGTEVNAPGSSELVYSVITGDVSQAVTDGPGFIRLASAAGGAGADAGVIASHYSVGHGDPYGNNGYQDRWDFGAMNCINHVLVFRRPTVPVSRRGRI